MTSSSRDVRIVHLLGDEAIGGGGRYVFDLIRHCGSHFSHVVALPARGALWEMFAEAGVPVEHVDMTRRVSLRGIREVRRCARRYRADILHTHGYRSNLFGRIALPFAPPWIVTTVHVSLFDYLDTPRPIRAVYLLIERVLAFRSDRFICISAAMQHDALRMGANPARIVLIPNGVDLSRFHPRPPSPDLARSLGITTAGPIIGTVGRLEREKGQIYLLESLPRLLRKWPSLRCVIVGKGPLLPELRRHASALGVEECCVFCGVWKNIEEIYPLFDVFVLPSIREPFGLVLLEAMASEIPVVATAAGGPLDFLRHGVNGLLVPPKNPDALAEAIDLLLSNRPQARQLASSGRTTIEKGYSIEETAKRTAALYLSLTHAT